MKTYNCREKPLEIHGVPFFEEKKSFSRLPEELCESLPFIGRLGRRTPGARLCFRTDSPKFTVRVELDRMEVDTGMSVWACQSSNVLIGERSNARFAGLVAPKGYQNTVAEKTFEKSEREEEITVFLPRNEVIVDVEISVEETARLLPPTPYRYPPILFYGSSITEGGCAARLTNHYCAILSNRLDADFYNFGFSNGARGEKVMADYISTLPMSLFVYDYDHNAPSAEHLANTHEPFFKRIREKYPELPVLMLSRPNFYGTADDIARRETVRRTYENALRAGDENVRFIDGERLFGERDRSFCTVDGCHPNDLGFYRMAEVIEPVVSELLKKRWGCEGATI